MNQKIFNIKTLLRSLVLSAPLLLLASCDDIAEGDRVVLGEKTDWSTSYETSTIEADGESFAIEDKHRMLIADFTGWMCVNCPAVAEFLTSQITSTYPSVLVSLHMTTNSFSKGHLDGYNCASADSIADWIYGSKIASQLSLPSVSIDNVTWEGSVFTSDMSKLGNLALSRNNECNITKTAPQVIVGINVADNGDNTYSISTLVKYPKTSGQCNLKLWLIEEGLISTVQQSSAGIIKGTYLNHGILRQVINGSYEGQNLALNDGTVVAHNKLDLSGKSYVPANCRVVAIVTDVDGREVINCAEVELVK